MYAAFSQYMGMSSRRWWPPAVQYAIAAAPILQLTSPDTAAAVRPRERPRSGPEGNRRQDREALRQLRQGWAAVRC
jgi:hypothetical protein